MHGPSFFLFHLFSFSISFPKLTIFTILHLYMACKMRKITALTWNISSWRLSRKIPYICFLPMYYSLSGAYEQEHATALYFCHGVFIHRFIFKSNPIWMRLPWESHNQSQDTNWRHFVTGPELPFFLKRKGVIKIDLSVKMPWHRLSMGVACSKSLAPDVYPPLLLVILFQTTYFKFSQSIAVIWKTMLWLSQ